MSERPPPPRVRLPLYGKILVWFFLNLVIVAAVFALLFNAQFNFNLDWFFFTGARERMEAVRDLIVGELESTAPDEWPAVMKRYGDAHRVRFALFDDDANPLVGDTSELPAEVRLRIVDRDGRTFTRSVTLPPGDERSVFYDLDE